MRTKITLHSLSTIQDLGAIADAGEHSLSDFAHGQRLHGAHQISLGNFRLVGDFLVRPLRALVEFQQDAHLIGRNLREGKGEKKTMMILRHTREKTR